MSDSRRSRWGNKPSHNNNSTNNHNSNDRPTQQRPPTAAAPARADPSSSTVSDDQALQALLTSADQRQEQKIQEQKQKQRKRWDDNNRDRDRHNDPSKRNHNDKNHNQKGNDNQDNNYYQPQNKRQRSINKEEEKNDSKYSWGDADTNTNANTNQEEEGAEVQEQEAHKPNFGLSGALANDDKTGNVYNGILLKFSEPPEARTPNTRWRFYVFKKASAAATTAAGKNSNANEGGEGDLLEVMHISKQSAYLFGREAKVADIPVHHPSLSKQHAVLQYRALPDKQDGVLRCKPYLMDLGSTNGTFINGVRIDDARYYELRKGDVITLGSSRREYVLLTLRILQVTIYRLEN